MLCPTCEDGANAVPSIGVVCTPEPRRHTDSLTGAEWFSSECGAHGEVVNGHGFPVLAMTAESVSALSLLLDHCWGTHRCPDSCHNGM